MNKDNTIIFVSDFNGVLGELQKNINDYKFKTIFRNSLDRNSFIYRLIRKFNLPFFYFYLDKWRNKVDLNIRYIVLFDDSVNNRITSFLKRSYPNAKIILYYWNKINDFRLRIMYDKNIDSVWTFDYHDSKKYNINYNPQFYVRFEYFLSKDIYDFFFIGRSKKRKVDIENVLKIIEKYNNKIIIVENEKDYICYKQYLEYLSLSKCIIDIINDNQEGLTLRVMESLFFEKKLVTNNKRIKGMDFYCKDNIFIIGEDRFDELDDFINKPYKKIDKEIVDNYSFYTWIQRFDKED